MDIDGGDITPEDFMRCFPDIKMACFNIFSGKEHFRVYIPTDSIMTVSAYKDIVRSMRTMLEMTGYRLTKDGENTCNWDKSKLHPASLFYMPFKGNTSNRKDRFFKFQDGALLNVMRWLENPVRHPAKQRYGSVSKNVTSTNRTDQSADDGASIETLIKQYRATPAGVGKRNAAFFKLACNLKKLGLSYAEIRKSLIGADYDGSREQKGQIESCIASLKKYQRSAQPKSRDS